MRTFPEDFVVEEVPLALPPEGTGKWTVARIRARNWETNRLVQEMQRRLGIGRHDVHFAGTKDKRAVTTQYFSLRAPQEAVRAMGIRDVDVLDTWRSSRAPKIGELRGNRFEIVVRDLEVPPEEALARARATVSALEAAGGFPNYYGLQRFGVVRPVTHVVGERILRGDLAGAVEAYVAEPLGAEEESARAARERYTKERDPGAALAYYPQHMTFERQMLAALARTGDPADALRALPRNLLTMFTYAFQSLLFNRALSRRLEEGLPLDGVAPGDLVYPADEDGLPDRSELVPVTEANAAKVGRRVRDRKAFVSGLVPGSDPPWAAGAQGRIEREVLDEARVGSEDFLAERMPEAASGGTRREVLCPLLGGVQLEVAPPDGVRLAFFLPRGAYATCLLREIMKAGSRSY